MTDISAIIVAHGSPKYLTQTIDSVKILAEEIIIVDIGLDQDVLDNLSKYKKVIIQKERSVPYVELIREKTKQYATHEYILFLDPDEIVSTELAQNIQEIYQKYDYISIPRKNIIFGTWIQHSRWWPDNQIRLFNKNKVTWPKKLHAQPKASGNGYVLAPKENNALTHHNYERISDYIEKMNRYAQSAAKEHIVRNDPYTLKLALSDGMSEFISRYFASDGYKDGMHGFTLAFLQLMYYPLVYFYYWEEKKYSIDEEETKMLPTQILNFFKDGVYQSTHWLSKLKLISFISKLKNSLIKIVLS